MYEQRDTRNPEYIPAHRRRGDSRYLTERLVYPCHKGPQVPMFTRGRRSRSQRRVLIQEIPSLVVSESIQKICKEEAIFEENAGTTRAPASRTEVECRPKIQRSVFAIGRFPILSSSLMLAYLPATPSIRSPHGIASSPRGLIGFAFQEPTVPLSSSRLGLFLHFVFWGHTMNRGPDPRRYVS